MSGFDALYFFTLALLAGYVLVGRTPAILHMPLLGGAALIHGVVLAGTLIALANAEDTLQTVLAMLAVCCAAANVTGAFLLSDRLLSLFDHQGRDHGAAPRRRPRAASDPDRKGE